MRPALSKPAMPAAVMELGALDLVASVAASKGPTGRSAVVNGLGPATGYVIGVDAGTTGIRAVAASLDMLRRQDAGATSRSDRPADDRSPTQPLFRGERDAP